jgi:hypothetical protein
MHFYVSTTATCAQARDGKVGDLICTAAKYFVVQSKGECRRRDSQQRRMLLVPERRDYHVIILISVVSKYGNSWALGRTRPKVSLAR